MIHVASLFSLRKDVNLYDGLFYLLQICSSTISPSKSWRNSGRPEPYFPSVLSFNTITTTKISLFFHIVYVPEVLWSIGVESPALQVDSDRIHSIQHDSSEKKWNWSPHHKKIVLEFLRLAGVSIQALKRRCRDKSGYFRYRLLLLHQVQPVISLRRNLAALDRSWSPRQWTSNLPLRSLLLQGRLRSVQIK